MKHRGGVGKHEIRDGAFRWDGAEVKTYAAAGTQSRGMSKQVLFDGDEMLATEVRYFEAQPGGYSALERHEHVHHVVILRGHGHMLYGDRILPVQAFDDIHIPGWTYHQFYAATDEPLGFLCLVNPVRDRPVRPSDEEIDRLLRLDEVKDWIRY